MGKRNEKKIGEIPVHEPFQLCWISTGNAIRSGLRWLRSLVLDDYGPRCWTIPVMIFGGAAIIISTIFFFCDKYTQACLVEKGDAAYIQSFKEVRDDDHWVYIMRDGSEYVGYDGQEIGSHICD